MIQKVYRSLTKPKAFFAQSWKENKLSTKICWASICLKVLSNIVIRSGMESSSPDTTPQKLQGQSRQEVRNLENMSNEEFYDLLLFLSDTAVSLATFLTIYPPSCSVLHEFQFCQQ